MKKIIINSSIVIGILVLVTYYFLGRPDSVSYEYVVVKKADIIQEVSVTGKVKPVSSVELGFNSVGRVAGFNFDVGDRVSVGDTLAYLDNADLQAELSQAEASIRVEQARLDELQRGTRSEELRIQEAEVNSASDSLLDSKNGLVDKIKDSYTKSDDAIRNRVDRMFENPRSREPKLTFVLSDAELKSSIEFKRFIIESKLISWSQSISNLTTDKDVLFYSSEAILHLNEINSFLDELSFAVNSLLPTSNISQTTIDTYKSETATARTNINLASSNLLIAKEKFNTSSSALIIAKEKLSLKNSGTALEQINAQKARVDQAIASANGIRAKINKTIIRSPINGIITKKNFETGEIVSSNLAVVSVISDLEFEMEANIPEADISKVKIGDIAKVTLDAYGSDIIFEASVIKIDPAETMIEGVATYKTTLQFNKKDDRIKSGMTSNIDILTNKKDAVVAIPQRSVKIFGTDRIVMIDTGSGTLEERKITTGLKGSDGMIEILTGLVEGDKILSIIE